MAMKQREVVGLLAPLALLALTGAVAACGAEGRHLAQVFPTHVDGGSSQTVTDGPPPNSFVIIDRSTPTGNLLVDLHATYFNPVTGASRAYGNLELGTVQMDPAFDPAGSPAPPGWAAWGASQSLSQVRTGDDGHMQIWFNVTPSPAAAGIVPTLGPAFDAKNPAFNASGLGFQTAHGNYAPRLQVSTLFPGSYVASFDVTALTADHWQLELVYLDPDAYDLAEPQVACKVDADCLLVDTQVPIISSCASVEGDQSLPQWQAVNKAWYVQGQTWGRSPADDGRLPCDQTPVASVPYAAHCQAAVCGKAPAGAGSHRVEFPAPGP